MSSSSFNRPGAVDLSQLAQQAKQSAPASPLGPRTAGASYVVEVTEQSFEAETIRKSVKHPVVVELYSPRVATGQQLSDALIEIADASDGYSPRDCPGAWAAGGPNGRRTDQRTAGSAFPRSAAQG